MNTQECERKVAGCYERPSSTWSESLRLTEYDHAFEESSFNGGFSGSQSITYRGTWRLSDDGTLELHSTEREDDLDYGSASRNTTVPCDRRSVWRIVWGEDGEVASLLRGDEAFSRVLPESAPK